MKKNDFPVSKKFYSELVGRVEGCFAGVGVADAGLKTVAIVGAFEAYMIRGVVPDFGSEALLSMAFELLRPEVDKAMARSRRARLRRRVAAQSPETESVQKTTGEYGDCRDVARNVREQMADMPPTTCDGTQVTDVPLVSEGSDEQSVPGGRCTQRPYKDASEQAVEPVEQPEAYTVEHVMELPWGPEMILPNRRQRRLMEKERLRAMRKAVRGNGRA